MSLRFPRGSLYALLFVVLLRAWQIGAATASESASPAALNKARQLIAEALRLEIAGELKQRGDLLRRAAALAPNDPAVRWHNGFVNVDGEWVSLSAFERRTAVSKLLARYRERRSRAQSTPADQALLAAWCRKSRLPDEARAHWTAVLEINPYHALARKNLNIREFQGQLITYDEVQQRLQQTRKARADLDKWKHRLVLLRRDATLGDTNARERALDQIRQIDSPAAIPAMEEVFSIDDLANSRHDKEENRQRAIELSRAHIASLASITDHAATYSLVRIAIDAPIAEARTAAAEVLGSGSMYDYVPLLLADFQMPIRSQFFVQVVKESDHTANILLGTPGRPLDGSGIPAADWRALSTVHYGHRIYREGRHIDQSLQFHVRVDPWGYVFESFNSGTPDPMMAKRNLSAFFGAAVSARQRAEILEAEIKKINEATAARNRRLKEALTTATGLDYDANPRQWWNWWHSYNELEVAGPRPVDARHAVQQQFFPVGFRKLPSCFVRGTLVATSTGLTPIEEIQRGDRVLAQDPNTGELAYKPVLATTVRKPTPILALNINGETIKATRGHPFWVNGTGWKMAKFLEPGMRLHTVNGFAELGDVKTLDALPAYNLIVANFRSYFVGRQRILVHDNMLRRPTRAIVPGLVQAR